MKLGNLLTAMVTPFDQHGDIDYHATKLVINYLLSNGTDGLVVAGTTGESPTLSLEEKVSFIKHVVKVVDGRAPVIAGTGSNCTRSSIKLTKLAEEAGVDGVMLVTPYYNKPSQEGMYQHFKSIAESTKLPIMLYNIPGRSSVNMLPETIIRLSHIKNITSVKEASGDLEAIARILSNTPSDFLVYSGDDSLALPTLSIGGHGVVSVASHIIGNDMKKMITEFMNGNIHYASTLHRELLPLMNAMFSAPNPTPVKAALSMIGINVGTVRLPLVPLTKEETDYLFSLMKHRVLSSVG